MILNIEDSLNKVYDEVILKVEIFWPKIVWALIILLIWIVVWRLIYLFMMFIFKKIKLNELVDKLKIDIDEENTEWVDPKIKQKIRKTKFSEKIKVDNVVAKSFGYYIVIVFFRIAISYIWITEIENFLKDVTYYLPNLFVWVMIWFFGIRFANFIYDVVYHTLSITKEKTNKIIASGAKIIILFFTLMVFLDYTKIVNEFILNTILIWFISMLSLWAWLAFWLGWKDVAKEILESFRK